VDDVWVERVSGLEGLEATAENGATPQFQAAPHVSGDQSKQSWLLLIVRNILLVFSHPGRGNTTL